ncbi:MAG: DNA polymerase III subunit epsilon [Gammaproteobacteria bacterium]|nr:DNA polymerase III subunit epsilon [Gammaproteobacteria bacterium]
MRQLILDTETTGISAESGHRVIEIGVVEIVNRRITGQDFQSYLNPERRIDPATIPIHGITDEFIADKPLFKDLAGDFLDYVKGAEVIMHNAPFDTSFINNELALLGLDDRLENLCEITDTLVIARKKHPGQRNSLDALCSRYEVDTTKREVHGALIDAKLLANVYLLMTGGQVGFFNQDQTTTNGPSDDNQNFDFKNRKIIQIDLNEAEVKNHQRYLEKLSKVSKKDLKW